jgi:hypothetical protein
MKRLNITSVSSSLSAGGTGLVEVQVKYSYIGAKVVRLAAVRYGERVIAAENILRIDLRDRETRGVERLLGIVAGVDLVDEKRDRVLFATRRSTGSSGACLRVRCDRALAAEQDNNTPGAVHAFSKQ